jgi:hypothetical protein
VVSRSPYIMKDERPCGEASSLGVPVNVAQDEICELKRRTPLPGLGKGVRVDSLEPVHKGYNFLSMMELEAM